MRKERNIKRWIKGAHDYHVSRVVAHRGDGGGSVVVGGGAG